jgi:tetratricopeptide (TPR) repeat protein
MNKKRRRGNPWMIGLLLIVIGLLVYANIFVVPNIPPPFVPTPTITRSPESYQQEAEQLSLEGKFLAAIDAYQAAINTNPTNIQNYLRIARLQIQTRDYERAQVNCGNAILLDNQVSEAYALLGWAKAFQKDYLAGEQDVKRAIELDPNSSLAHAIYAYILGLRVEAGLTDMNTQDQAIEQSRMALALNPNLLEAHWARGYILELTANYEEAASEFEKAIAINPNISNLHMALGRNYFTLARDNDAIFEFSRALALDPTDPIPNYFISRVWANGGEFAKAAQYAEAAVRLNPTDPAFQAQLGTMYFRQGLYNQSIPFLALAVVGGQSPSGESVTPIPLAYNNSSIEIYSRYGIALARVNKCTEANALATVMLETIADDADGVYNANEILKICRENLTNPPTPTLAPTATPVTGPTSTPEPSATPQQ